MYTVAVDPAENTCSNWKEKAPTRSRASSATPAVNGSLGGACWINTDHFWKFQQQVSWGKSDFHVTPLKNS